MNIVSEDSIWKESKQCGECGVLESPGQLVKCDCGNPFYRFKKVWVRKIYYKPTFLERFWSWDAMKIKIKTKWRIRDTKP